MTGNRGATPVDLERIDAHAIADPECQEVPELTDGDFARGTWSHSLVIDQDVLARFRATGPGWDDRVNRILRAAAEAPDAV